ncbi:SpoIIE family protein phosphatase [Roseofilum sp. BLCC_M143]|uniref:SpoIIE family protein phosphatase n=2 Tax=Roseofilum TaxID=1233426 RepID=A0ABT7BUY9_9CYAN|nr:SpoIIE family protein phosphatase [Roseofilum casamattae BLCC-M143]
MLQSFSRHSLRFQLTILVVVVAIACLGLLSWSIASMGTSWLEQSARQEREDRARHLADTLENYNRQRLQALRQVSQMPEIATMMRSRQEPLLQMLAAASGVNFAQTFDRQGTEIASTLETRSSNVMNESWFQRAIADPERIEVSVSPEQKKPFLCTSVAPTPVGETGAIGVLRTCIDLVTLTDNLGWPMESSSASETVLDRQGNVLIHTDRSLLSRMELVNWRDRRKIQPALLSAPTHFQVQDEEGILWLSYALAIDDNLIIVIQEDASQLQQQQRLFWQYTVYFLIGSVVLIGSLVWKLATQFTRPITDLIVVATTLFEGELVPRMKVNRRDEIGILIDSFNRMADQLQLSFKQLAQANQTLEDKVARRTQELEAANEALYVANRALNYELEKGRQIQRNFLPKRDEAKPVTILELENWEVMGWIKPARQVAGDFYDAFELDDDYIGLVIADICDKGVGAALFMPLIQSLIRIFSGQTSLDGLVLTGKLSLDDLLYQTEDAMHHTPYQLNALKAVELTNDYLAKHHGNLGMFATLFFGVLDLKTGNLVYVNGGHLPLFAIDKTGGIKHSLVPTGPAVGISEHVEYKSGQVFLEPGDVLFGYTDGVTDARSPDGLVFSLERLQVVLESPPTSGTVLLERIANGVAYHRGQADQFDDMTLLVVRRSPRSTDIL